MDRSSLRRNKALDPNAKDASLLCEFSKGGGLKRRTEQEKAKDANKGKSKKKRTPTTVVTMAMATVTVTRTGKSLNL